MRSPLDNPIAQQTWLCVHPDGSESIVTAKVGTPYLADRTMWKCPAALDGIDGQYADIAGEGSMQALGLALRLIRTRLSHAIEGGATLYFSADRSAPQTMADLGGIFGG